MDTAWIPPKVVLGRQGAFCGLATLGRSTKWRNLPQFPWYITEDRSRSDSISPFPPSPTSTLTPHTLTFQSVPFVIISQLPTFAVLNFSILTTNIQLLLRVHNPNQQISQNEVLCCRRPCRCRWRPRLEQRDLHHRGCHCRHHLLPLCHRDQLWRHYLHRH